MRRYARYVDILIRRYVGGNINVIFFPQLSLTIIHGDIYLKQVSPSEYQLTNANSINTNTDKARTYPLTGKTNIIFKGLKINLNKNDLSR